MAIGRIPEPGTGIPESIVNAKGDLIAATANDVPARLAVGTTEHRLVAASGETTGLKYVADTTNYAVAAKGDLLVGTAADTLAPLTVGTNGHTLVADSAEATGLKWAAPAGGGKVLQVVQSLTTGYIAITSNNTYEDANLSATITPTSASSKILVMVTQGIAFYTDSGSFPNSAFMRIMRGGTAVWNASPTESLLGQVRVATDGPRIIAAINYLDSPATTSATTYKPQYKQESNANAHTIYMNYGGVQSTITLMEIGA